MSTQDRKFTLVVNGNDFYPDEMEEEEQDVLAKAADEAEFHFGAWSGSMRKVEGLWRWDAYAEDLGELEDREGGDLRDVIGCSDFIERMITKFEKGERTHPGVQVSDFREAVSDMRGPG